MPFDKRKERSDTIDIMDVHDYASPAVRELDLCATSLPVTPSKPPAHKKGKSSSPNEQADSAIISTLSSLINTFDALEGMISANALKIEGLKNSAMVIRDALWKAAKNSQFLKDNNLRFAEDLTSLDRERRKSLWPRVREARAAGKMAYYFGARPFIEGVEITL